LAAVAMDCISLHARLDSKVVVDGGIATAAKSDTDEESDTDGGIDTDGTGDVEGGRP